MTDSVQAASLATLMRQMAAAIHDGRIRLPEPRIIQFYGDARRVQIMMWAPEQTMADLDAWAKWTNAGPYEVRRYEDEAMRVQYRDTAATGQVSGWEITTTLLERFPTIRYKACGCGRFADEPCDCAEFAASAERAPAIHMGGAQ